jgi:hypothetical protein
MQRAVTAMCTSGLILVMAFGAPAALSQQDYQLGNWKLQVSLVPEKASFVAGEPINLSFTIRNNSTQDLQVLLVADTFNWLYRPERFTIQVVREDGLRVPIRELPPGRPGGNRKIGPEKIPANGTYSFSLSLSDWVDLKEPGSYTVTAARTLDISEFKRDNSWQDPNNLSHLTAQASAKVSVAPFSR